MKNTGTVISTLVLLTLFSSNGHGFPQIHDRFDQIDTLPKTFHLIDGIQGNDTLPQDLKFHLKPAGSQLEDWELLLRAKVNEAGLTLEDGRPITTFDVFKTDQEGKEGVIVGSVNPVESIDISLVADVGKDSEIQVMFNNTAAQVIEPNPKDIGVFNFDLERQTFQAKASSQSKIQTLVFVLVDVSGSMVSALPGVAKSGRTFLQKLPQKRTQCMLGIFNHRFHNLGKSYWNGSCAKKSSLLKGIRANGGTNIYSALLIAFQAINARKDALGHEVKPLVLVVTDGAQNDTVDIPKTEVIKAMEKSDTTVFTFWQGTGLDKKPLEGITAFEMENASDIERGLSSFFSNVNLYNAGQMHLLIPKGKLQVATKP